MGAAYGNTGLLPHKAGQGLGPAQDNQALIAAIGQLRVIFPDCRGINHHIRAINVSRAVAVENSGPGFSQPADNRAFF